VRLWGATTPRGTRRAAPGWAQPATSGAAGGAARLVERELALEVDEQPAVAEEERGCLAPRQERGELRVQQPHERRQAGQLRVHAGAVAVEVGLQPVHQRGKAPERLRRRGPSV